jgi:hypothetical protein
LWTICPGWPRTTVLPISASQVARLIGVKPPALPYFSNSLLWISLCHLHMYVCSVLSFCSPLRVLGFEPRAWCMPGERPATW